MFSAGFNRFFHCPQSLGGRKMKFFRKADELKTDEIQRYVQWAVPKLDEQASLCFSIKEIAA